MVLSVLLCCISFYVCASLTVEWKVLCLRPSIRRAGAEIPKLQDLQHIAVLSWPFMTYSLSYIILLSWPIWHELTRYDWWQFWNLCRSVLHYTATLYQIVTNFAAIVQAINASPDKTAHLYCIYVAVGWVNRLRSFVDDTARGMWDYVRCLVLEVVCTDVSGWLSHHVFSLCYIMYFRYRELREPFCIEECVMHRTSFERPSTQTQ